VRDNLHNKTALYFYSSSRDAKITKIIKNRFRRNNIFEGRDLVLIKSINESIDAVKGIIRRNSICHFRDILIKMYL